MSILLIDDHPLVSESLSVAVRLAGHALDAAATPEEALSRLASKRYDAILLDMNYAAGRTDGQEGLALIARILADDPAARIVVVTAHSGIRIAVEAMRAGARDFVMKPWRNADLLAKLTAAAIQAPAASPPERQSTGERMPRLLGNSASISPERDLVRRVGPTMANVIVTGASGTGRSLVAAALHAASTQAMTPLIRIDLRDSSAWDRIESAQGALLLRHPDRLSDVEHARLLDRLPEDARVIAIAGDARMIDPALAHRIATVEIAVPSLAERGDDALVLARHFVRAAAERHGRAIPHLTPAAEATILSGGWPDEVRGLAATIERAVLLNDGDVIEAALLSPIVASPGTSPADSHAPAPVRFDLEDNERAMIEAALREHHHNVTHAATALGLSRGALYRRMARHGL